jgi:predicted HicB family RNase H-like nuclease
VTFEGRDVGDLKKAFGEAVEDYINLCRLAEKPLHKLYKGSFNVRMTVDFHKRAARESAMLGISLNQVVQRAVEKDVRRP